jgi:hypothetical protein
LEISHKLVLIVAGKVGLGCVYDKQVAVLRQGLYAKQFKLLIQKVVFTFDFLNKAVRQGRLAVTGKTISGRQLRVGNIVDGGGQNALSGKGNLIAVGIAVGAV